MLLTGSGPTLFAFFIDEAEAGAAIEETPVGTRGKVAASPVPFGWAIRDGAGPVMPSSPVDAETARLIATILDAGS